MGETSVEQPPGHQRRTSVAHDEDSIHQRVAYRGMQHQHPTGSTPQQDSSLAVHPGSLVENHHEAIGEPQVTRRGRDASPHPRIIR